MDKLFKFQEMDEFLVPCNERGVMKFINAREPHKVTSRLLPEWCKGVVVHRPTHNTEEPDNWIASDVVTHMSIPINNSTQMNEAVIRVSAILKTHGEQRYFESINYVRENVLKDYADDKRLGFDLLNSNDGGNDGLQDA